MLLPVFVATFAGLRVGAFRIMGGCRRAFKSPRTIHKGKNTAIGHARLEEGARLLRTARRAGGRPWRLAPGLEAWLTILQCGSGPAKTLGFTGCSRP